MNIATIDKKGFNKKAGYILQKARKTKNISQYELSEITGISRISIAQYELGNSAVPLAQFIILCRTIDVDYDALFNSKYIFK